jgi:hypothetical protein
MNSADLEQLELSILALACVIAFVRVMVLLFTDHGDKDSPWKAWLLHTQEKARLEAEYDLEKFRIDKNLSWDRSRTPPPSLPRSSSETP